MLVLLLISHISFIFMNRKILFYPLFHNISEQSNIVNNNKCELYIYICLKRKKAILGSMENRKQFWLSESFLKIMNIMVRKGTGTFY